MHNELEIIHDYVEAGFRVFPLYSIEPSGKCGCGDDGCEAVGKHPIASSWQKTPDWSDEQLQNMLDHLIKTGFGVLVGQRIVVDIDPRNGGDESYARLCKALGADLKERSKHWVQTGGGGAHIFFNRPEGAFVQTLPEYPGIDFKTTGFVVGCGSLHASGALYERGKGYPQDVGDAPDALLDLLRKRTHTRAVVNGFEVDITVQDLREMLKFYSDSNDYETWIHVGMALHHSTQGGDDGYQLWRDWSSTSEKYNEAGMPKKWHSFGKSHNPITLGSLIHWAEQAGYVRPVTFQVGGDAPPEPTKGTALPFDASHCDPIRPPGLTGKIAAWIDEQGFYPRQRLSCMASIMAVGNAAGIYWQEDVTGVSLNLLSLCVAGSGTGKEAVQEAFFEIMRHAGLAACVHGDIKSKQEITRNLIEHQPALYLTDEIGEILRTIENAKKRGGAAYLEGVTGDILKIFTKAHSVLPVAGDVRRDLLEKLGRDIQQLEKQLDDAAGSADEKTAARAPFIEAELEARQRLREMIRSGGGLPQPFLSMLGFTTLDSLEPALSVEMAKNGFLNRAFIIEERETNPKPNPRFKRSPFPYENEIKGIATGGSFDASHKGRIEHYGSRRVIRTEGPANTLLGALQEWQWHFAEHHKVTTGYEALARRAYEFISKVSAILAIADGGVRTLEHVEWAAAFVKWDIDEKIRLISYVDSNDSTDVSGVADGLASRVISICQDPQYPSVIAQRLARRKGVTRENVTQLLDSMVGSGALSWEGAKLVAAAR